MINEKSLPPPCAEQPWSLSKKTGYLLASDPAHEVLNLPFQPTSAVQTLMGQCLIHHLPLLESNSHPGAHTWLKMRNPVKDLISFICCGPKSKPTRVFISTTKAKSRTMKLDYLVVQIPCCWYALPIHLCFWYQNLGGENKKSFLWG